jgi:hypothetical protein
MWQHCQKILVCYYFSLHEFFIFLQLFRKYHNAYCVSKSLHPLFTSNQIVNMRHIWDLSPVPQHCTYCVVSVVSWSHLLLVSSVHYQSSQKRLTGKKTMLIIPLECRLNVKVLLGTFFRCCESSTNCNFFVFFSPSWCNAVIVAAIRKTVAPPLTF